VDIATLPREALQRVEDIFDIVLGGYGGLVHPEDKQKILSARQEVNAALTGEVDPAILELKQRADLYEKLRKLNPRQFTELHAKNLAGQGAFDDLVSAFKF